MTDDQDYIMKDESMSHDSQSKKMKQALLRLNNDIYEFKCNQFSTKMIDISVSDICNPGNKFSLSVNMTWKDVYFLPNEEYKVRIGVN